MMTQNKAEWIFQWLATVSSDTPFLGLKFLRAHKKPLGLRPSIRYWIVFNRANEHIHSLVGCNKPSHITIARTNKPKYYRKPTKKRSVRSIAAPNSCVAQFYRRHKNTFKNFLFQFMVHAKRLLPLPPNIKWNWCRRRCCSIIRTLCSVHTTLPPSSSLLLPSEAIPCFLNAFTFLLPDCGIAYSLAAPRHLAWAATVLLSPNLYYYFSSFFYNRRNLFHFGCCSCLLVGRFPINRTTNLIFIIIAQPVVMISSRAQIIIGYLFP